MGRLHLPSFAALRAFEAVARHSSFTRAAAELGLTQGAVSYQVKQLEEELGLALFRREGRVIRATDEAQRLLPVLQRAFAEIAETVSDLRPKTGESHLTVALSTYFAAHWLSRRLGGFSQQNPGLKLRLQHPESPIDFHSDDVHMAIRWHKAEWVDPELNVELLFLCDLSPVCSPRLQKGKHALARPKDLHRHTLLRDEVTTDAWSAWFKVAGIDHTNAMRELKINDPNVYIQAAVDEQGVALGDALVADEIALGRLMKPFDVDLGGYGYFIVYPRDALKRPGVRAFRDWLLTETAAQRSSC